MITHHVRHHVARLPPASPACCDRPAVEVSHPHSNNQRLTAHAAIPQVGFSVARRRISARTPAGMAGRPGRTGGVVQRRVTSCRCQRRMVEGVTISPSRRRAGSSRARAAMRARSAQRHPRPWCAPLQHRELMAQDEDLDVLGGVGADAQHHPAQQLREHQVDQLQRHRRIMSGWLGRRSGRSTAVSTISGTHTDVVRMMTGMWHPDSTVAHVRVAPLSQIQIAADLSCTACVRAPPATGGRAAVFICWVNCRRRDTTSRATSMSSRCSTKA